MTVLIYLSRKSVSLDAMLAAELIVQTIMYVNLVESVAIGERSTR
jgi:hypothetical protein